MCKHFRVLWETGSYITHNGANIKFCVEVSVQSTTKSSPWLAELVLVQLLAISTRHSTAGLWTIIKLHHLESNLHPLQKLHLSLATSICLPLNALFLPHCIECRAIDLVTRKLSVRPSIRLSVPPSVCLSNV